MDVRAVVATSMDPQTSALCMAQHLEMAGRSNVEVIVGEDIHGLGVGIWKDDALVGFPLREKCLDELFTESDDDLDAIMSTLGSLDDLAEMMDDSERNDWVYISLGGMTSLATLTKEYPEATGKIEDLIVMAANICSDLEIYPFVRAPAQETNAAADPEAANFIFSQDGPGKNFYIMPVDPGQGTIEGEHYEQIIEAAESDDCPGATALIDFYSEWNKQARADETILTHFEAIEYDPKVSSALRYDPTCVLYAAQLLTQGEEEDDFVTTEIIPAIWFDDDAYTYIEEGFELAARNVW